MKYTLTSTEYMIRCLILNFPLNIFSLLGGGAEAPPGLRCVLMQAPAVVRVVRTLVLPYPLH
jgi:hypothetical protein